MKTLLHNSFCRINLDEDDYTFFYLINKLLFKRDLEDNCLHVPDRKYDYYFLGFKINISRKKPCSGDKKLYNEFDIRYERHFKLQEDDFSYIKDWTWKEVKGK